MTTAAEDRWISEMYVGFFKRAPETNGWVYNQGRWDHYKAQGQTEAQIMMSLAEEFFEAAIILGVYSFADTTEEFVSMAYENVFSRPGEGGSAPTPSEIDYWVSQLQGGTLNRGELLINFITSARTIYNAGSSADGYTAARLLRNRGEVGIAWANSSYGNISDPQVAITKGRAALDPVTSNPSSIQTAIANFPNV